MDMKHPSYMLEIPMETETIRAAVHCLDTVIVGTGAAGYGCAHALATLEQNQPSGRTFAIVTEGVQMGTSRNTGSDKQTYYKLSTASAMPDCAYEMACDLAAGGSMHGDLALVEAVGSLQAFYRLTGLGVPFPQSRYGEFPGYQTDHDEKRRATSCGPLTSKYMTECLQAAVEAAHVPVFDGCRVIGILTEHGRVRGLCALSDAATAHNRFGLCLFEAANIVYAVGGPSAIYAATVYPESQTCALGAALLAGAEGVNLTELQYGIASVKFRWNLSGSYQQVLPRYISVDGDGTEREFLADYFPENTAAEIAEATFLLGYQWPFDAARIHTPDGRPGSSAIDLAVFAETCKGNGVYLDFTRNPRGINAASAENIGETAYTYLQKSDALGGTPVSRLRRMNEKAYQLYLSHGIDLAREPLEIRMCAQHCNGGLAGDIWYESTSLRGFYPIGEANGVFGVRRPGGSALNSTQVGGLRAAKKIHARPPHPPSPLTEDLLPLHVRQLLTRMNGPADTAAILRQRTAYGIRMSECGAFLRNPAKVRKALTTVQSTISSFFTAPETAVSTPQALRELSINYDILITQSAILSAIDAYICDGGLSRGSYAITDKTAAALIASGNPPLDTAHTQKLLYTSLTRTRWEPAVPIPVEDYWFEKMGDEENEKTRLL